MSRRFLVGLTFAVLALPPLFLAALALPRLEAASGLLSVQRVLLDRLGALSVAPKRLEIAQKALAGSLPGDGENVLWRAELLAILAGRNHALLERARLLAIEGLTFEPANPRGWTLLCEIDVAMHRSDAARCLDTAFYIGPFDWFVANRRTVLSAYLWPSLDADTRDAAARRVRLLFGNPKLRDIDFQIARTANGRAMLAAAFRSDPGMRAEFDRLAGQQLSSGEAGGKP
jgi:hypothetical protein